MKTSPRKKQQRVEFLARPIPPCLNCGLPARHYVHPWHGDPGFFICDTQGLVAAGVIEPYQKSLLDEAIQHAKA